MRYAYPAKTERDEAGRFLVTSRDVPEAVTDGGSLDEALDEMGEALGAALAGYAKAGRGLPAPSPVRPGEHLVPVPALVAAKLALMTAMQRQGVSNSELARRLGVGETQVRRLVDPDHGSRIDAVLEALAALGGRVMLEDAA